MSRCRLGPSLSTSALLIGVIAAAKTGFGISGRGISTGVALSASVSKVWVWLSLVTAPMSPATIASLWRSSLPKMLERFESRSSSSAPWL